MEKEKNKFLIVFVSCIVLVIVIAAFSTIRLAKGTFAAIEVQCSVGPGSDGCKTYRDQGYTCSKISEVVGAGDFMQYSCVKLSSQVSSCEAGKFLESNYCHTCGSGKYCAGGTEAPKVCVEGQYCATSGLSAPADCPAGWYCPNVLTKMNCPAGSYCPAGSSSATACPNGKTSAAGATSSSECYGVSAGNCGDNSLYINGKNNSYVCSVSGVEYNYSCTPSDAEGGFISSSCTLTSTTGTVTITFMNSGTVVATKSCDIATGSTSCSSDIIAPGAQTPQEGKTFTGWGGEAGCTQGSYTNNAAFRPTKSATYYACFSDKETDSPSNDFTASKCSYSGLVDVTRDQRYLNCKYTNITYNNSAAFSTVGNVSACCSAKGYTFIPENFTSSGYGNEYCLVCGTGSPSIGGSTGGGGGSSNPTPENPKPDNPTPEQPTPENPTPNTPSNVTENPTTGTMFIIVAWLIGLVTLIYTGYYVRKSKIND